jgi:hypothetical protein
MREKMVRLSESEHERLEVFREENYPDKSFGAVIDLLVEKYD